MPKNVWLIHPYSDCSNPTLPVIAWVTGAGPILVRFCSGGRRIDDPPPWRRPSSRQSNPTGEPAARRLYREDVRRLTPPDGRRAMPSDGRQRMTPIGRHRAAPNGRSARCPLCVMRHRLWPGGIPARTPATVRITSPPAPGKAPAASAHSETGSRMVAENMPERRPRTDRNRGIGR